MSEVATNVVELTKVCTACSIDKSLSDFTKDRRRRGGLGPRCRKCTNEHHRKWCETHPEAVRKKIASDSSIRSKRRHAIRIAEGRPEPEPRRAGDGLRCAKCREVFPDDHFSELYDKRKNRAQRGSYCRSCASEILKDWRGENPERVATQQRRQFLRQRYGLTDEAVAVMHEAQGGRCGICRDILARRGRGKTAIDHCHDTGAIRGLLCARCNSGLGFFRDDEHFLENALAYLRRARGKE